MIYFEQYRFDTVGFRGGCRVEPYPLEIHMSLFVRWGQV